MSRQIIIVLLIMFCSLSSIVAQKSYGTWLGVSIDTKVNNWKFEAETELRTISYLDLINRWSLGLNAEYRISKPFRVGMQYELMNTLDQKYLNYQFRNRFNGYFELRKSMGDFSFSIKEAVILTTKDDSKRIKASGKIDTYAINPAWKWKNDFQIAYDIPKSRFSPGFKFSTFYELNNPKGNQFDKIRYTAFLKYKVNKKNAIRMFGIVNSELGDDDADYAGKYILGFKYSYSFR